MLHSVTGKAKFCGPCALSAVTGESSNRFAKWNEGRDMNIFDALGMLAMVEGVAVADKREFKCSLSEFGEAGVWLLSVRVPAWGENEGHMVAVAGLDDGSRQFADNTIRHPVPLAVALMGQLRTGVVVWGARVVSA